MSHLLLDIAEGVALLTVNRPNALNALNSEVLDELQNATGALNLDDAVKVVVVTGSGEKAFVAGADIAEMAELNSMQALAFARNGQKLISFIGQMNKPVIAAVNGFALGGGLELALACDFIYASETAKFGLPEVTLGIMPGFGGTQKLPRLIGRNRANEMIFTGKMLTAAEAREWGIVNAVLPAGDLLDKTIEVGKKIAQNGILGISHAKKAINTGLNMGEEEGIRYESALFGTLYASADQKEGMQAFLTKRKPVFTGR